MFGLSPVGIIKEVAGELKPRHLIVGAFTLFALCWGFSRLAPGAAARMGIRPRPLFDAQNSLPEPFGMQPLTSLGLPGMQPTPSAAASSASQIIAAATGGGSADILQGITSGNA